MTSDSSKPRNGGETMSDSNYHVGQVIRINTAFYETKKRIGQKYQAIVKITPWPGNRKGQCLRFANGDECHEKWVKPLTKKEARP